MEFLNQSYTTPYMTALKKTAILNIHFEFFCLMKRDIINWMFPLAKRDISELDSRYEPEIY